MNYFTSMQVPLFWSTQWRNSLSRTFSAPQHPSRAFFDGVYLKWMEVQWIVTAHHESLYSTGHSQWDRKLWTSFSVYVLAVKQAAKRRFCLQITNFKHPRKRRRGTNGSKEGMVRWNLIYITQWHLVNGVVYDKGVSRQGWSDSKTTFERDRDGRKKAGKYGWELPEKRRFGSKNQTNIHFVV